MIGNTSASGGLAEVADLAAAPESGSRLGAREERFAFGALSPKEWRVAILAIEGVAAEDAARTLGIAMGTLQSHRQAIRRKLDVPRYMPLEPYLREHLGPVIQKPKAVAAGETSPPTREQRTQYLLRLTLEEIHTLARRAESQASSLRALARSDTDDLQGVEAEAEGLTLAASVLSDAYHDLIRRMREGAHALSA
ncbi:MAG TPA: LuxR C-terminal-related transcriptional regulator [Actinomycetota bacterium]|nr:LuxR C-terminal-related transcriptional regulator [Actinomycetota bacterium]